MFTENHAKLTVALLLFSDGPNKCPNHLDGKPTTRRKCPHSGISIRATTRHTLKVRSGGAAEAGAAPEDSPAEATDCSGRIGACPISFPNRSRRACDARGPTLHLHSEVNLTRLVVEVRYGC